MQFVSDTDKAIKGIQAGVDTFTSLQANKRANAQSKREQEKHAQVLLGLAQQLDLQQKEGARAEEDQGFQREDQAWQKSRRAQDQAEDEAFKEAQGRLWSGAFGEDPPEGVVGPREAGSSGAPKDTETIMRGIAPLMGKVDAAGGKQLMDTARTLGGTLVRSRHSAQTKSLIQSITQQAGPDGKPAVGEDGAPVGILAPEQAQQMLDGLEHGIPDENGELQPVDVDQVDHLVHNLIREDAKGKAAIKARQGSLLRVDTVAQNVESGALGPILNPMAYEEALTMRNQLESLPLSGDSLAAAERRINAKMFEALSPASGKGGSSAGSSAKAPEVSWKNTAEDKRSPHQWYERAVDLVGPYSSKDWGSFTEWKAAVNDMVPAEARSPGGAAPSGSSPASPAATGAADAAQPTGRPDPSEVANGAGSSLEERKSKVAMIVAHGKAQGWTKEQTAEFVRTGEPPTMGGGKAQDEEANEKAGAPDEPEGEGLIPKRSLPFKTKSRSKAFGDVTDSEVEHAAGTQPEDALLKAAARADEGGYQKALAEYRKENGEPGDDLRKQIRNARRAATSPHTGGGDGFESDKERKASERNAAAATARAGEPARRRVQARRDAEESLVSLARAAGDTAGNENTGTNARATLDKALRAYAERFGELPEDVKAKIAPHLGKKARALR